MTNAVTLFGFSRMQTSVRLLRSAFLEISHFEFFAIQVVWMIFAVLAVTQRHLGLSFFDSSEFATHIRGSGIPHAPGYPLYILFSKLFFWFLQDPFEAQFWLSLLSSWICTFFFYITVTRQCDNKEYRRAAFITLLFFLSGGLFQLYLRISDVFFLSLALFSILFYFHRRLEEERTPRWIFGIGAIYGLGACHHPLMALSLPASLFFLTRAKLKDFSQSTCGRFFLDFCLDFCRSIIFLLLPEPQSIILITQLPLGEIFFLSFSEKDMAHFE